jgi:hypothetical protein
MVPQLKPSSFMVWLGSVLVVAWNNFVYVHPPVIHTECNSLAGKTAVCAAVILGLNLHTVDREFEVICCWIDYL